MEDCRRQPAAHFVLVHGASHGGWCWYKLRRLLEKSGHKVTCIDLAGAGIDRTDSRSILTFEEYNKPLLDFMSELPDDHKIVLVGHSLGGLNISQAIQEFSGKIATAIYLAAAMLRSGVTVEYAKTASSAPPSIHGTFELTDEGILTEQSQRKFLYNESPEEDIILASLLLRPSPPHRILLEARFPEGEGSNNVKRVYVKLTNDRMVKRELEDFTIKLWPPTQVCELATDHSPFFSNPQKLHDLLVQIY